MRVKKNHLILIIFLLFLFGCAEKVTTQETPSINESPEINEGDAAYPITEATIQPETSYPITEIEPPYPQGPEFVIDQPVKAGEKIVTGTGEPNVPIKLVDVSEVGLLLGETIINSDGTFIFTLDDPIQANHVIGIQLGNIEDTDLNPDDFLYSETYYERPMVGILFDMVIVED